MGSLGSTDGSTFGSRVFLGWRCANLLFFLLNLANPWLFVRVYGISHDLTGTQTYSYLVAAKGIWAWLIPVQSTIPNGLFLAAYVSQIFLVFYFALNLLWFVLNLWPETQSEHTEPKWWLLTTASVALLHPTLQILFPSQPSILDAEPASGSLLSGFWLACLVLLSGVLLETILYIRAMNAARANFTAR